jgi:hypothetical protein
MREICREDEADHAKHRDEDGEDHVFGDQSWGRTGKDLEGHEEQLDGERVEVLRDGGQ